MVKRRIEGNDDDDEFSSKRVQDRSHRKQVRQKQDRSI